ncbi:metallophosphoesterase [Phenylobacterium sp.]|jgi:3',5'-cyclic AMP phosphodiesterase CpdA|uniref:metallophosphoesterase family protein n=1 Tax=Phenylobacterium sp. TaxID=1871053 RepID=UPI002F4200A2
MSVRIAHLSDIHFGGEVADAVEAAIGAIEAFAPTLTVVSGDLTLNGLVPEFRAAARWLERLPTPRLVTPGNHDTPYWNLPLRALTPFARYRRYIGPATATAFDSLGLAARTLNSARGAQPRLDWSKGAIAMEPMRAIAWGDDDNALRVFICHHPLIDIVGAPVTGGVRCGDEAAAVLADAGVDLILTGHVHNPFVLPIPGAAPGRYAVGAGTLSLRTRGSPPSFSTITAGATSIDVAVQAWTGVSFQPGQSWTLPRGSGRIRGPVAEPGDPPGFVKALV